MLLCIHHGRGGLSQELDGVGYSLDQLLGMVRDNVLCMRSVRLEAAAQPTWLLFYRLFPIYSNWEDSAVIN